MAHVTVTQPGMGEKGGDIPMGVHPGMVNPEMGFQQQTTIVLPAGLPPSLGYLASLNEVKIHQHFDTLEVLTGCERNNKYRLCNTSEQQFLYAKEDTDCMTRQCCGNMRPFIMNITDNQGIAVMQLDRPFRCVGNCTWCCYMQEMDICSPPGNKIGSIHQKWTCWIPEYEIRDGTGNAIFTIKGECCYGCPCQDIPFQVLDHTDTEVARITKHWSGCREIFGGVNDFSVQFPVEMDVMKKSLLLGSTFLIDFVYFERNKNN